MVVGRIRRWTAAVAVLAAVASACSGSSPPKAAPPATTSAPSSSPATAGAPAVAAPQWRPCQGAAGPSGYQCATLQVPRDPEHPGVGGTIGLALDRRPASGARIGSLLVNPGGPGASGVDFLPQVVGILPKAVLQRFDVIGFDPPGVGRSAPVVCLDGPGLYAWFHTDPDPHSAAGMAAYLAADRTFAAGCERNSAAELPYVSTVDAAIDMDAIRQAVGDPKLTYLGFSYGTFLGATYAGLYPTRVRAMVLDGALDPSLPVLTGLDEQSAAFDQDLRSALEACVSSSSCPWRPGGDPMAAFEALLQRVRSQPLPVRGTSRTVGPAELLYGTAATLYATGYWPTLYDALARAEEGDGTAMLSLFDDYTGRNPNGTYSNEFEANTAVNCLDAPAPTVSQIEAAVPAARAAAPVFGAADLYSEIQCALWPVPATSRPSAIHADGSPPIVVVGTTGDPATPYSEAVALAGQLQHGILLTRVGEGHTGYPYSSCVRDHVDRYLIDLVPPAAGLRCASD
jgi:pimeloyl-ACP methyl ester carboxylesterase